MKCLKENHTEGNIELKGFLEEEELIELINQAELFEVDKATRAMNGDVQYYYGIIKDTQVRAKAREYINLAASSTSNAKYYNTASNLATVVGAFVSAASIGYIGLGATLLNLYVSSAKSFYVNLRDIFALESTNEGACRVVRIPFVLIDPDYDKHNPRPATRGKWQISVTNLRFMSRGSETTCRNYISSVNGRYI